MSSAKIKVMSAGAVEGPVHELASAFTRETGREVALTFNTVGALKNRFVGGEQTDMIILSFPAIEGLEKDGRLADGSRTDLGRASCGVAVRDGMLMPDVSTIESFTRMLKNAGSIAANDPAHGGGSSARPSPVKPPGWTSGAADCSLAANGRVEVGRRVPFGKAAL